MFDLGELERPTYLTWLASGDGGAGQGNKGLAAIAEALRLVEKNDERIYEAEVYRVKGNSCWRRKAGSKELGARTALNEAHRILSEVYSWFTEGFDTKDLQEAEALLVELGEAR